MPNSLTGDFEAVLQVSGTTVNRLLASMHQNAFADPERPSLPHAAALRIGDSQPLDGVRGTVHAQVGSPTLELIHGATDRFQLEVSVRAQYEPDPGSEPLPAFIHGTVRAEYRIDEVDPRCAGWGPLARNYLWIRVVRDSVRFAGTAEEDRGPLSVSAAIAGTAAGDAANISKITRQIALLLASRFEPTPHRVTSEQFRRGRMRSLVSPGGDSAIALPLAANGSAAGQIGSIGNILLDGSDFALGVSRDRILSVAQPALDAIAGYRPSIPVNAAGISTVYRVAVNPPTVQWQPSGSFAVISVRTSGTAQTDSILPNATFEVHQEITVNFAPEQLWLAPGSRTVRARASGLGSGAVAERVKNGVSAAVQGLVQKACADAQPSLDALIGRKQELVTQLRTLDAQADAHLDMAAFFAEGLVLRGSVSLAPRQRPIVRARMTEEGDGYTGFDSWIPGGRVDRLEWTWTWVGTRPSGAATHDDRFLLRRPAGGVGPWGMAVQVSTPLPGLDGQGTLCLRVRGVQRDTVTGALVRVESVRRCLQYRFDIATGLRGSRAGLFLRDVPELSRDVRFPELALVRPAGRLSSTNTLLLYVGRGWDYETTLTLRGGLERTRRRDAGLTLLVLFHEGLLHAGGPGLVAEIEELGRQVGLATVVDEDVHGSWAKAYRLGSSGELAWRLLSPHGGVTWKHQGRLEPERLAHVLEQGLIRGRPARPSIVRSGPEIGSRLRSDALEVSIRGAGERQCPPLPLSRLGDIGSVVSFVRPGSSASERQLRELTARYDDARETTPLVMVVVDGADEREVERWKNEVGFDFPTVADPAGTIGDRLRIQTWPTTVVVGGDGLIAEVRGGTPGAREEPPGDGE